MSAPAHVALFSGVRRRIRRRVGLTASAPPAPRPLVRVAVDKLLMGGDSGLDAARYSRLVEEPLRPSTPIAASPHAQLLRTWNEQGDAIFAPAVFEQTAYYRNAARNIEIFGHYFDARCPSEIEAGARRFVDCFRGAGTSLPHQRGQSPAGSRLRVRAIRFSDCYQVVDGHHRAAMAAVRGDERVLAELEPGEVMTPLQTMLLDVLWLNGRKELYQPVDAPEIRRDWVLVRRCTDRLRKMLDFLDARGIGAGASYLDVACSYGWFVHRMLGCGFGAAGVERDPLALRVGRTVYGLPAARLHRADAVTFLAAKRRRWDVVSCFSILHHLVRGQGAVSAAAFARLLDDATGKVLFLDTGQNHEGWYRQSLAQWDAGYIERWLRAHTSFTHIVRLGPDGDGAGRFEGQFGRMLFACYRDGPR